jgi:hypothetical protein
VADYALVTLGAFTAPCSGVLIGGLPRELGTASNALAQYPVQTTDYVSGFRIVTIQGWKLAGVDTMDETCHEHLERLWHNLLTEVAKDSNTLTIDVWGFLTPKVYTVYKNEDPESAITPLTQSRAVMKFDVRLNCLP